MVTDEYNKNRTASIAAKTSQACWKVAMSEQLSMAIANLTEIASIFSTFGYTRVKHHSGFGGYAKMIAAKLIPESIDRTIVIDSDTIFNAEFEQLWRQFDQFSSAQVLMGKRLGDHYCVSQGNRINSGVVLMDLKRMRDIDWTDIVMSGSRNCHECAAGDTLFCGDQEFISMGCQNRYGACSNLEERLHYDYCNERERMWNTTDATIYHFNCRGDVDRCPGQECRASLAEWKRFFFKADATSFERDAGFNQPQRKKRGEYSDLAFDLSTWTWTTMHT